MMGVATIGIVKIAVALPTPTTMATAPLPTVTETPTVPPTPTPMPTATETATPTPMPTATLPATATAATEIQQKTCNTIFVDLKNAPEGVWSNASAILVPEGWCVVLSGTPGSLLLCNPGPGNIRQSLEKVPGYAEDEWNDQAKEVWAFPDPRSPQCGEPGTIFLYENDWISPGENDGWEYAIEVSGR